MTSATRKVELYRMNQSDRFNDEPVGGTSSDEGSRSSEEGSEDGSEEDSDEGSDGDGSESEGEGSDDKTSEGIDEEEGESEDGSSEEGSEGGFEDEGRSKDSDESDSDPEDDSSSESAVEEIALSGLSAKDRDTDDFLDDVQDEPRGRFSGFSSVRERFGKIHAIGLASFCVLVVVLAIGLGVGLGKDDKNDDKAPIGVGPPTAPPVRPYIRLPLNSNIRDSRTVEVSENAVAERATTIYRNGFEADSTNDSLNTTTVKGGESFALITLPLDPEKFRYAIGGTAEATFCMEHVPREGADLADYSACIIDQSSTPAESEASYNIPDDCFGGEFVNFGYLEIDRTVCFDVTSTVMQAFLATYRIGRRRLRGSSNGDRSLQVSTVQDFVMMIDSLIPSNGPGDEFYTMDAGEGVEGPSITITAEEKSECTTIVDAICGDERLNVMCTMLKITGVEKILRDNRATFTVFAVTADPLSDMLSGSDGLSSTDIEGVREVMMNHVLFRTPFRTADIDCNSAITSLTMANGQTTKISCIDEDLFVSGMGNEGESAAVIESDIQTCNGILHVIDGVLMPSKNGSTYKELLDGTEGEDVVGQDIDVDVDVDEDEDS